MSFGKIISFANLGDDRGDLFSLEASKNIPFDIKRVYYMRGLSPGKSRGFHAHRDLSQVLVCVAGRCDILLDNGVNKKQVVLGSPSKGLLVENMVWREMHNFSEDCVLMVLASNFYDENDYIRDYDKFLSIASD